MSKSIAIAQINPIAGNIEYNAQKIVKYINQSQDLDIGLVVFPESALIGFSLEDVIKRHPVVVRNNLKWINEIAKITTKTFAIVGFVDSNDENSDNYYNAVAILAHGKIQNIIRKSQYKCCNINGINYGILIGEDSLYDIDKIEEKPDVFIICSASESRNGKEFVKNKLLSDFSKKYKTPLIYVNQVGAIDNISFDGASRVYGGNGNLIARAKSFEEHFLVVNSFDTEGEIAPVCSGSDCEIPEDFTLDYEQDLERTYKTIIQGIRDYFKKTGFERAVLGLSGGLDSTVCAVLLADSLGAENVLGVSMPSKITSDESKNDAQQLAQNLGINFAQISIKDMFETVNNDLQKLFSDVEQKWNERYKQSYTPDNIQARSRATILWGISNEFGKTLPIATSDKSEAYMGYATINGDMSGGFAPIADVTKTKLFALARWMNKNRVQKNVIPQSIIDKKPGAELAIDPKTGKPLIAEDALMPYEFLDEIIWRVENKKESYNDMLNFKFLYEQKNNISKEQKIQWLDKFYRRMSTALYKWSIMPSGVVGDAYSINKCEYSQPITSSNIDYRSLNEDEIRNKVKSFLK